MSGSRVELRSGEDLRDPRLAPYTSMTDAALRRAVDAEHGIYLAESSQVVRRALAAGHTPRSFLLAHRYLDSFADVLEAHPHVPVFTGPDDVLAALTGFHLHRGALAAMDRPVQPDARDVLAGASRAQSPSPVRSRIAVFDGLVEPTNLGAGFRSAAALGVDAVLITPTCADPLYRRAIRVSMGTVFQVPWTRVDPWPGGIEVLREAGYVVAGLTLEPDSISLEALVQEDHDRLALVFGTEGHGLLGDVVDRLDRKVMIPMMHGVDSLNVAAASAVAFYATR
ncbi:tRNA G18 (ribose-2'-O)-methylase SpoU [Micrococcus cohnii]|uniref:tRNA G18 (Ribose-2'-O)-methylase SpoU n=1 Tax=Micrococcus cohnii TaxID=993416 RepID=A0A7W7GN62_9MICC|nr:RNA methyltransferase [Micrococcus cohnii]MBB4735233.1 tRNA G18 (ribose-2'-O)-methylase SpoU [Micrococcus cohnii]